MKRGIFVWILLAALLSGCGARTPEAHSRTVFAMDTVMNLTVYGGNAAVLDDAEAELRRLDAALARTREGSDVDTLNRTGSVRSIDVARLTARASEISAATDGAFDVTVAPVLALWGFGENAGEQRVPDADALADALARVGYGRLSLGADGADVTLESPAQIDFGGIAKGYADMRLRQILEGTGVESAVFDLGGDVCVVGTKPDGSLWRVAVKDPADGERFLGVLETADVCVMTSGVYERYFEENGVRYHHILDPRTGCPAQNGVVSATVICADGVWADALATALVVLGAEESAALRASLTERVSFDYLLVTEEGKVLYTCDGFTPQPGSGYDYEPIA